MKKRVITVISILLVISIAVTIGVLFNKQNKGKSGEVKSAAVTDAVPTIDIYYENSKVGTILGYTNEMNEALMRDTIVPVAPSRQSKFKISTKGNKINSIRYEVESTEDNRLIDSGDITNFETGKKSATFVYEASAIMEVGTEYILKFTMTTDKHEKIFYYTRAMVEDKAFVAKQIAFAKDFSDRTFDETKATVLAKYLEVDNSLKNDNLGQISIKSNYSLLLWSALTPTRTTEPTVIAKEFCIKDSGEAGTYTLNYQIEATNAEKIKETYNISETITVWTYAGKQYVLAYDREMNQVWEAKENNIGNAFIDFGIQNFDTIEHAESDDQQFIAFQINGDVYNMNILSKEIQSVYKINAGSAEKLRQTKSKVIKVDNKGNVDFMVYGYSLATNHCGKNGISIMHYNSKENKTTETTFIPTNTPASILENELSQLCYVGDGSLYLMIENSIYFANLTTQEWGIIAENLEEGSYAISSDSKYVALNDKGEKYADSIVVINLKSGKKQTVDAPEGSKIIINGYTGTNLIYGICRDDELGKINKLVIVDNKLTEIKSYEKSGVFITAIEINDNIINIKRQKNGKAISDDQLLDNTEKISPAASSSYYNDDLKLKELALSFTNNLDSKLELKVLEDAKVEYTNNTEVTATFNDGIESKYFVYGYGKLQSIETDKKVAIKKAREAYGLVVDAKGQKIWIFEENYN